MKCFFCKQDINPDQKNTHIIVKDVVMYTLMKIVLKILMVRDLKIMRKILLAYGFGMSMKKTVEKILLSLYL